MAASKLYASDMLPRATMVSLGESQQIPLALFNSQFGSIPLGVGCTVADMKKGKGGKCTAIGFVKGMEGERVTLNTRGRKGSTRNHFGLVEHCRVVPHVGYFARHLTDKILDSSNELP